jgi:mono/diheme cytochrome c family protein
MKRAMWGMLALVMLAAIAAVVTRGMGFTSRAVPFALEETAARALRRWLTPVSIRNMANPVVTEGREIEEVLRAGMEHWADHCASCHANDGSGDTAIGKSLYPPAPDMRGPRSQGMTDGELFYVIERGIPFTGMPAWGTGTADGERQSWELVRFIRHLPDLTMEELERMEQLNPMSPAREQQEKDIEDFLSGRN